MPAPSSLTAWAPQLRPHTSVFLSVEMVQYDPQPEDTTDLCEAKESDLQCSFNVSQYVNIIGKDFRICQDLLPTYSGGL